MNKTRAGMKYNYYIVFATILSLGSMAILPSAFADTVQVTIIPGSGSSDYCSGTATCFTPSILNISPGDIVTWTNNDNVGHALASGMPYGNQTGIFDSGTIAPKKTYSFTFQDSGTYKYFDKDSKWMVGEVIVGPSNQPPPAVPEFGTMAPILLAIAFIFIIVASKNRSKS